MTRYAPDRSAARRGRRWTSHGFVPMLATDDDLPPEVHPDPSFDRFARVVRTVLGVPTSLVTIVESDRQIFPGASGTSAHYNAEQRQSPLSRSLCKLVVAERAPIVIDDLRNDEDFADNSAISELGIVAYAGFPLTDRSGEVIGSLCALDVVPREWSHRDRELLADLAEACSSEIVLRELRNMAASSAHDAWEASHRARVLLSITERLSTTRTPDDVALALHRIATDDLGCAHAGVWNIHSSRPGTLRYVRAPGINWEAAERLSHVPLASDNPIGACLLYDEPLFFPDREMAHLKYPSYVSSTRDPGVGLSGTCLPLVVDGQRLGTLVLNWPGHRDFTDDDQLIISALAVATTGALQRAWLLDDHSAVAARLQRALLTDLPRVDGLQIAARYRAARAPEQVGGDWYDAVQLADGTLSVSVGDVVGHDLEATAAMGPLRSTLRAFAWHHNDAPSVQVRKLDRVMRDLYGGTLATLVHARIAGSNGRYSIEWTNAGHPAPVLVDADGRCHLLEREPIDCLLAIDADAERHDHHVHAASGSTLLMFTDGLLGNDIEAGQAMLDDVVGAAYGLPFDAMLDRVIERMVPGPLSDDVALLAVRFD